MTYISQLGAKPESPIVVGFLGFDGMSPLDLTGPLEAFAAARAEGRDYPCYETVLIAVKNKMFVARSGATFMARYTIRNAPVLDTLILPGGPVLARSELSETIAAWLRDCEKTTRRIASVSAGIYPLAQSGLLDGRRVTTHWRHAQNVARTFRRLQVDDSGSFIQDDRFSTAGGGTAGIEMCLALIREDYGSTVALNVAREMVMDLRPPSAGERQIDPSQYQPGAEDRLAELPAWISSRLRANLSVEVLAERTCLCPRHFSRVFKRAFLSTPADFVEHLRISEAARLLMLGRQNVGAVADSVGFKSTDVFRRAFERRFGVSPAAFQKETRKNRAPFSWSASPLREWTRQSARN